MKRRAQRSSNPQKRRTTLTLPCNSLQEAQRIANAKNVNLSTVIALALREGLRLQTAAERRDDVLENYRKAFSGFSDEELSILDGVIFETSTKR
jgi:hypothetical protein